MIGNVSYMYYVDKLANQMSGLKIMYCKWSRLNMTVA